ncbi:hypothetical protein MPSEU_000860500 [Mayamaea pseudoterrestris]|nr:hypothetical protein MPSEU_000860500 [Mayamaea pseudoterrestris]
MTAVIIKGTEVYNPEKGGAVDLSILDVQQIFGRAGRPQFDSSGEATLITSYDAYQRYITKLVRAVPIESNFIKQLPDHLNAEIVGGTVSTIQEAVQWLGYTYLHIRMLGNPLAYGIKPEEKNDDPTLVSRRRELIVHAAKHLSATKMIAYAQASGNLSAREMGRTAAHFYVQSESVATFNDQMGSNKNLSNASLVHTIASASEFQNMKVRQEELEELEKIAGNCPLEIRGAGLDDGGRGLVTSATDKAFLLIQAYISKERITSFTLISDVNYISANAGRIARALFEMCLKQGDAGSAMKLLRIAKSVDNRIWWFQTPLRQFEGEIRDNALLHLEKAVSSEYSGLASVTSLLDLHPNEVGSLCHWHKGGEKVQSLIRMLPQFEVDCRVLPVTGSILKFHVTLTPTFVWHGRWHGGGQSFWFWIENTESKRIYHHEQFTLTKAKSASSFAIDAMAPIFGESGQFVVKIISDSWVGVEQVVPISIEESQLPRQDEVLTKLQDLTPLPTSALQNAAYEKLYPFHAFNPIQTQLFHVLYHTDSPVLLGAPTGSGKTIVAELALLRLKKLRPSSICVYIAPLKALARERLKDWQRRLGAPPLNWNVLELSGDTHHDLSRLERSDVLICTPEKWDLLSRGWRGFQTGGAVKEKSFVKRVGLLVIDEVHLLGEERGAVLEAIVSRTRFISRTLQQSKGPKDEEETRIVGLSTSLANAVDLGAWIGIETESMSSSNRQGLFNFSQYVRPIPIAVHVQGFSGKHYCPRMATMNKPCYAAIKDYAPTKPTLIFVASRRQTRLTAIDLISYAASDEQPMSFLDCSQDYIESVAENIRDESLRHTLTFGIGLHHAGLTSADREVVERLFLEGRIRVLVATATLAWGLNLPGRLCIVKGTEYFDGKSSRYVDYPLTDVLQMIGRAGRPGFDTQAFAVVMATEDKKNFYKKFLYTSFPVESCLQDKLCENINAEIASGTISTTVDALGYLSWTFFARRVKANPSYYGAKSSDDDDVEEFLFSTVKDTLAQLDESGCIVTQLNDDTAQVKSTSLSIAAASYYLSHRTPKQMQFGVKEGRRIVLNYLEEETNSKVSDSLKTSLSSFERSPRIDEVASGWLLYTLCSTHEFDEHPVRHNEEHLNEELSRSLMWGPDMTMLLSGRRSYNIEIFQDPHTKCFLLLQAYLQRAKLPITDYVNDTMSVVDNVPRLLAAMEYIACQDKEQPGSFELLTQFSRTRQFVATKSTPQSDPVLLLVGAPEFTVNKQKNSNHITSLREIRAMPRATAVNTISQLTRLNKKRVDVAITSLFRLPLVNLNKCAVSHHVDKATGKAVGKLEMHLQMERQRDKADNEVSLTILLGSYHQKMLLGQSSIRIDRSGKFDVVRTVEFDWNRANADGGAEGGRMIIRLLFDNIRGLDAEMLISLT